MELVTQGVVRRRELGRGVVVRAEARVELRDEEIEV